jgi:cytochrome c oxidase subunit 4
MAYAQPTPLADDLHAADEHHDHPGEGQYIRIAIILSIITAVEVAIYYIEALESVLVPILVVLSTVKFLMVVGYFMHLKFDDKRLAWIFAGGMILALSIYIGTWAMMHFQQITEFFSNMKAS